MAKVMGNMYFRGDFSLCQNYEAGDVVRHRGALYLAEEQSAGKDPLDPANARYWRLISASGDDDGGWDPEELYYLTRDQKEAVERANHPSADNPFLTAADMPALEKRVAAWQLASKPSGVGALYDVAFGNGVFIAVGDDCAARSQNGRNWEWSSIPEGFWRGVAHGGGIFVAVGLSGLVGTSGDGTSWETGPAPEGEWNDVAFGNGLFVAVCDGRIMSWPVGGTTGWTRKAMPAGYGEAICFGDGVFAAIGPAGVMTSPDGDNWTRRDTPAATWRCGCWGADMFVALAGKCMVSEDSGETWDLGPDLPSGGWDAVCYGGGFFVGVGNSAQCMVTGDSVLDWKQAAAPNFIWRGLAFGLDTFVAVGSGIMAARIVDAAAAMNGAHAPSEENAFATLADISDLQDAVRAFQEELARIRASLTMGGEA